MPPAEKERKKPKAAMPRRRAERIQPYIAREVRQRLARHCAGLGLTESAVVNEALTQYLDGTSDAMLWMRRQDLLDRRVQRLARDVEILSQTVGLFLRIWLAHTPPLPKEARHAANQSGEQRYRLLLERVGEQFNEGKRFVDDIPPLDRDSDLDAERAASEGAEAGSAPSPAGGNETPTATAPAHGGDLHREEAQ
jgi:hypothetical protein